MRETRGVGVAAPGAALSFSFFIYFLLSPFSFRGLLLKGLFLGSAASSGGGGSS